jgi:aryl-alcohol dehydrogenase-like predicted oxidoreductase
MQYRQLGRTGWRMATVSFGAWAIGGSCAIPGAKRVSQVEDNAAAADLPPLPDETMARVRKLYDRFARAHVHQRW